MSSLFSKSGDGGSFLPSDYVQAKAETRTNLAAVIVFSVVMFGVVAAFMVANRQWASVKSQQREIQAAYQLEEGKIASLKELEKTRRDMLAKAKVTTALIESVPRSVLLAELVMRLPEGATLTELELESKRILNREPPKQQTKTRGLKGAAAAKPEEPKVEAPQYQYSLSVLGVGFENNDVADYLFALKKCPLLSDVEIEFIRDTKLDDMQLRRFRIVCTLRNDVDAGELDSIQKVADAVESGQLDPTDFTGRPSFGQFSFGGPDLFPRREGGVVTKAFDLVYGLPEGYQAASASGAGEE